VKEVFESATAGRGAAGSNDNAQEQKTKSPADSNP